MARKQAKANSFIKFARTVGKTEMIDDR